MSSGCPRILPSRGALTQHVYGNPSSVRTCLAASTPHNELAFLGTGNDQHMQAAFRQAMLRIATLGQNTSELVDCSAVIPVPPEQNTTTRYPAGLGPTNVDYSVSSR